MESIASSGSDFVAIESGLKKTKKKESILPSASNSTSTSTTTTWKKPKSKLTEEDKKLLRKLSETNYDTDDERNDYCARFTKEELDAMADDYISQIETGGYDVVTYPPPNFPYACYYVPKTTWFKEDKEEYRYAKEMAEFVIAHINAQFNDKSYCLVDVDKVVDTTTFLTLLTFRAKELPAGSDADGNADAVIETFQAKIHTPPPVYKTYILEEWRFKPVSNAACRGG